MPNSSPPVSSNAKWRGAGLWNRDRKEASQRRLCNIETHLFEEQMVPAPHSPSRTRSESSLERAYIHALHDLAGASRIKKKKVKNEPNPRNAHQTEPPTKIFRSG